MQILHIIKKPVVTEKATALSAKQTYSFWVDPRATKIEVKRALKDMYGVDVDCVRMINTASKKKVVRRSIINKKSPMKKALVTLKGGKKMDVTKLLKEPKESVKK